jgi:hypothetical protein
MQECQKCDDGSIGRRYRPIPQYELDISAKSVAHSFGRIRMPSYRQRRRLIDLQERLEPNPFIARRGVL